MMGLDVIITVNQGRLFVSACSFHRLMVEIKHKKEWE
jgi:hypothetical protein